MSLCCIQCRKSIKPMKPLNIDGRQIGKSFGVCPYCNKSPLIPIDDNIAPTIFELNAKGYKTVNCCGGHYYGDDFYILFAEDVNLKLPEFLHYDEHGKYENGKFIASKNCVRGELKEDTMAKLNLWAKELRLLDSHSK